MKTAERFFFTDEKVFYMNPPITRNPHAIASNKPRDATQPQSIRISN